MLHQPSNYATPKQMHITNYFRGTKTFSVVKINSLTLECDNRKIAKQLSTFNSSRRYTKIFLDELLDILHKDESFVFKRY